MLAFLGDAYSVAYGLVNSMVLRLMFPGAVCLAYLLFEMLLPRSRNSLQSYVRSACFMAASVAINTFVLEAAMAVVNTNKVSPLAVLDLSPLTTSESWPLKVAGWMAAAFVLSMASNGFYYWLHRAQHGRPELVRRRGLAPFVPDRQPAGTGSVAKRGTVNQAGAVTGSDMGEVPVRTQVDGAPGCGHAGVRQLAGRKYDSPTGRASHEGR